MSYSRPGSFQILPPVVKNLLIVNGLFFLATVVIEARFNYDLTNKLGLFFFTSPKFEPYQLLSHIFMHGNLPHILLNMFALWMFGSTIENTWGSKRFFIYYFVTGLGAAALYMGVQYFEYLSLTKDLSDNVIQLAQQGNIPGLEAVANASNINNIKELLSFFSNPVVGASGAVFGVLLAYGMTYPDNLVYVYFAIPIKAKYFVALYGAMELYQGIANNPGDNVAHFAHLGGMLFGFVLIRIWKIRGGRHSGW